MTSIHLMLNRLSHVWMLRGLVVSAASLAACHHAALTPSAAGRAGTYEFSEHVTATGAAGESIDIQGRATVFDDTVTVDARPGPCRLDDRVVSPNPFTYECGNVTLTFDRRDPVLRATYTATLAENQSRQVCIRYSTDPGRRSTCLETGTQTTQSLVKRSGQLRLLRAPN